MLWVRARPRCTCYVRHVEAYIRVQPQGDPELGLSCMCRPDKGNRGLKPDLGLRLQAGLGSGPGSESEVRSLISKTRLWVAHRVVQVLEPEVSTSGQIPIQEVV